MMNVPNENAPAFSVPVFVIVAFIVPVFRVVFEIVVNTALGELIDDIVMFVFIVENQEIALIAPPPAALAPTSCVQLIPSVLVWRIDVLELLPPARNCVPVHNNEFIEFRVTDVVAFDQLIASLLYNKLLVVPDGL